MNRHLFRLPRTRRADGFVMIQLAVTIVFLLLCAGLTVDAGRGYIVKTQLTKAVDGAALAAARTLNSGDPKGEATRVFKANFPSEFFGTKISDPTAASDFYSLKTDNSTATNIVTIKAKTVLPTTFMKLGTVDEMPIASVSEATRRMVDLSLVLDTSGSLGSSWPAVRDAARAFVKGFDKNSDRFSLILFSDGADAVKEMKSTRGFDKDALMAAIPKDLPGGYTAMPEGLYRGWDELRTVPKNQQSSLRVIVLFSDGAPNSVPGIYGSGGAKGVVTNDFPKNSPDPDGMTHNDPTLAGLYDTETGNQSPSMSKRLSNWKSTETLTGDGQYLPTTTSHTHKRSSGIPTTFALESPTLKVNGQAQSSVRGLRNFNKSKGKYPAEAFNIANAARNIAEIIADAVRSDASGAYQIRIYTIGMGALVNYNLGTIPETSESIMKRLANDKRSPDYRSTQLEGRYYYAATSSDIGPAFAALQNQIIRLTK